MTDNTESVLEEFNQRFGDKAKKVAFNSWEDLDAVQAFIKEKLQEARKQERGEIVELLKGMEKLSEEHKTGQKEYGQSDYMFDSALAQLIQNLTNKE